MEAPAELPQTTHTQVGMMQCYSTTPLELEGSNNNCTDEVFTDSAQQLINVSENVGVDTVGSASLLEHDQINAELELNKNQQQQQQQESPYQKGRTQYMRLSMGRTAKRGGGGVRTQIWHMVGVIAD